MSKDAVCFCGSMRRHRKCHPDISRDSLAAKMLSLYAKADTLITKFYSGNKFKPVCKKGCSECCSTVFSISIVEFFLICREMIRFDPGKIAHIKDRVFRGIAHLNKERPALLNYLRADHSESDFNNMSLQMYELSKDVQIDCPFLIEISAKEKICSIYNVRPLICRIAGTSYYTGIKDMHICSHIGTNKEIIAYGPSTIDIWDSFIRDILTISYNGVSYRSSVYPLIYWLYLAAQDLDNPKAYLAGERHKKYFQMPYTEAKQKILLRNT